MISRVTAAAVLFMASSFSPMGSQAFAQNGVAVGACSAGVEVFNDVPDDLAQFLPSVKRGFVNLGRAAYKGGCGIEFTCAAVSKSKEDRTAAKKKCAQAQRAALLGVPSPSRKAAKTGQKITVVSASGGFRVGTVTVRLRSK